MPRPSFFSLIVGIFLVTACSTQPVDESVKVGDAFVTAYYVETNLATSKQYCVAVACEKLKQEEKLREGQSIDAATKRPKIAKKLLKQLDAGVDAKRLIYQLTVHADGLEPFTREAYVKVRKAEGQWKVSQFAELKNGMPDTGL